MLRELGRAALFVLQHPARTLGHPEHQIVVLGAVETVTEPTHLAH